MRQFLLFLAVIAACAALYLSKAHKPEPATDPNLHGGFSLKVTEAFEAPIKKIPTAVAWSPDGSALAVTSGYGNILSVLDAKGYIVCRDDNVSGLYANNSLAFVGGASQVLFHAMEEDDSHTVLAVRDAASAMVVRPVTGPERKLPVGPYIVSADQKLAALAEHDNVAIFDTGNWKLLQNFALKNEIPASLGFTHDGTRLMIGTGSGNLILINPATGVMVRELVAYHSTFRDTSVGALALSPDGDVVLTGGVESETWDPALVSVQVLRVSNGARVATFPPAANPIRQVAWDPKGRYAVILDAEKIILWQGVMRQQGGYDYKVLPVPNPQAFAVSPDGGKLAVAAEKGLIVFTIQ